MRTSFATISWLLSTLLLVAAAPVVPDVDVNREEQQALRDGTLMPDLVKLEELRAAQPDVIDMVRAMAELRETFRTDLAQLQADFLAAPDAETAAGLETAIEDLKLGLEIRMLELQLDNARRHEKRSEAGDLERVLESLKALRSASAAPDAVEP
jgi:hypothetical protein